MKIKVLFVGKKNDIETREQELMRRIRFHCSLEVMPITPSGQKEDMVAKRQESEKLMEKIGEKDFVIALDEHGHHMNSLTFSEKTRKLLETYGTITFIIGGAYGLGEKVLERADKKISLGEMVWTKDLARLMLLEQIYRALDIQAGGNFHKK